MDAAAVIAVAPDDVGRWAAVQAWMAAPWRRDLLSRGSCHRTV